MKILLWRLTSTLIVLLAVFCLLCVFSGAIFLAVAIFHHASTPEVQEAAFEGLVPVLHFVAGAFALGGLVALANAVAARRGAWASAIVGGAVIGGFIAACVPAVAHGLLAIAGSILSLVFRQ